MHRTIRVWGPEETASFLRGYYDRTRDVIQRYGGIVEKFAGDAVMAVWGAQLANEDDAERAVRAGLELQEVVARLAIEAGDADVNLRVGVTTGEAAVRPGGNKSTGMVVGTSSTRRPVCRARRNPGSSWSTM
jgi:class 3 adenylate cyclase